MDQDFPFAENAEIVGLIFRDIFRAMWAMPAIAWAIYRARRCVAEGHFHGGARIAGTLLVAAGWVGHLVWAWAIPKRVDLDIAQLRRDPVAYHALAQPGRIGYFDCTIALASGRPVAWSARKLCTYRDAAGAWLWVEGNAGDPNDIAGALRSASVDLRFAPPNASTISAWAAVDRENCVPLMRRECAGEQAAVMLFREPNGWVTPCLLVRL